MLSRDRDNAPALFPMRPPLSLRQDLSNLKRQAAIRHPSVKVYPNHLVSGESLDRRWTLLVLLVGGINSFAPISFRVLTNASKSLGEPEVNRKECCRSLNIPSRHRVP